MFRILHASQVKRSLFPLILLCPLWAFAWQTSPDKPFYSREFPGENLQVLDIQSSGINVNVNSWEEERVLVQVLALRDNKPLDGEDAQLKKKLEAYHFDFREEGNRLILGVESDKKTGLLSSKDNIVLLIKVQCPKTLGSFLKTEGGSITLAGLQGTQELQCNGGSIRAIDCKGKFIAESSGGSIFVDKFQGEMELNSAGGPLRINHFTGSLKANSTGGSMNLLDISGKIIAQVDGGGIKANFLEPLEEISLRSKGGGIDMVLPKQLGMSVNFSASIVVSQHLYFEGESKRSQVKGTINGGGIPITASASGGNVKIDYY
jgi:hypothetical protein